MNIKLMKLKIWNGNHTKHVSFKRTNNKVKLGTLHFNNMKNIEVRYEALEDYHVLEIFTVGNVTQNLKDYLLDLKVDGMSLFIAVKKGGGKRSESVLVIMFPEAKVSIKK